MIYFDIKGGSAVSTFASRSIEVLGLIPYPEALIIANSHAAVKDWTLDNLAVNIL